MKPDDSVLNLEEESLVFFALLSLFSAALILFYAYGMPYLASIIR
jgi:hypothetical protein